MPQANLKLRIVKNDLAAPRSNHHRQYVVMISMIQMLRRQSKLQLGSCKAISQINKNSITKLKLGILIMI